ncbi:c-type cytochrome [Chloroflexota bacterium]
MGSKPFYSYWRKNMLKHFSIRNWLSICALTTITLLSSCSALEGFSATPTPVPTDIPLPTDIPPTLDYGVPAEDANVVNPIAANDASLERGEKSYTTSCIDCHGEQGRGDGLAATRLNPKPSDFRADHVKELSDGELFYIITYGIEGSAMQAVGFFDEEIRWNLVNYLRTFQE